MRELAAEEPLDLVVRGSCMAPALEEGSRVLVAPRPYYLPGDVVAVAGARGRLMVHRVVGFLWRRAGWQVITKGDRESNHDGPVPHDRILGRVCGGDCSPSLYRIGVHQRLAALFWFARRGLLALVRRAVP